jgi:hypothetical protein
VPELVELLQNAAKAFGGMTKDGNAAPRDELFMTHELFAPGSGGQTAFFQRIAQSYLTALDPQWSISRSCTATILQSAGVKYLKSKHTKRDPASDYMAHFCNSGMKQIYVLFLVLFSACSATVAVDPRQQVRLNSTRNNFGGSFQARDARTAFYDHSANIVEKEAVVGMTSMLLLPSDSLLTQQFIDQDKLGRILALPEFSDWKDDVHHEQKPGFALSLGHVERMDPENASRHCNSLQEFFHRYPEKFLQSNGDFICVLALVGDNKNGASDPVMRFCLALLFILYDLDIILRGAYAPLQSYLDPAEIPNGAISRRINGIPHQIDLVLFSTATQEEKLVLVQQACKLLCAHANGAAMSQYQCKQVHVFPADGPSSDQFHFDQHELKAFLYIFPHFAV